MNLNHHHIVVEDETIGAIRRRLRDCLQVLELYDWVINSFVLDFFLDSHWPHLPSPWRATMTQASPQSIASLLEPTAPKQETVWPLSLLAFKATIQALSLERKQVADFQFAKTFIERTKPRYSAASKKQKEDEDCIQENSSITNVTDRFEFYEDMFSVFNGHHTSFKHIFRKHVKPKKQYEMARLGKFSKDCMTEMKVVKMIDVGSGVGHLARYLSFAHYLQVACVDSNLDFTDSAKKFDAQLEQSVRKLKGDVPDVPLAPVHVNAYLDPDMDLQEFHAILSEKFQISDSALRYGIVGLHTCGDLGPVLLKMFTNDSKATVLQSVGCCYMKIQQHFPMSSFIKDEQSSWKLTYTNAELACHAIEMYSDRLQAGEEDKLKVHCYRAVLEKLLVKKDPCLRHSILKTVARAHELNFKDYAVKATSKLPIEIETTEFETDQITEELSKWWEVVTYYTIRLALAPLIETVILLDRCVYLYENGFRSLLFPLFDPLLSPRNQIIFATKK